MLQILNDKTYCSITNDEINTDKYYVNLIKDLTLTSENEELNFDTGITITLTEEYDELFVKGNIADTHRLYTDSYIIKNGEPQKLILKIANPLKKDFTLEKGFTICKLYKSFTDNGILDIRFAAGINIYGDEKVSAKSIDGNTRNFEIVTSPDGDRKLIINLDS